MEADPIEGMARALCWAKRDIDYCECERAEGCNGWVLENDPARAAWAYALARLREVGDDALKPLASIDCYAGSSLGPEWARGLFGDALDAFAREIGVKIPPGAPQEPPGRVSRFGSGDATSDTVLATEGASMEVSGIATEAKLAERKAIMDFIKARMSRHLQKADDPRLTDDQQQARMILAEDLGALWRAIERDAAERDGPQPGDPA